MQRQWRFVQTGAGEAAMNMALDEALWLRHEAGDSLPTLRVYSWSTPTLSLGYAQQAYREVELEACAAQGVGIVRRPTGGRAVLHDQEVTYSVVMPLVCNGQAATLSEHYYHIGRALEAACHLLGLPVQLARPQVRAAPARALPSPACFAALSRYELSSHGRKLIGSAQKRGQYALLQHGAIPLRLDRHRLFQCLQVPAAQRPRLVQEAFATMVAVNEIAPEPVTAAALHDALRQGFSMTFQVEWSAAPLATEEWDLARELCRTKYATASWNLGGAGAWRQRQAAETLP